MLLIAPLSGTIVYANKAAESFYGYPVKTLIQMNISDINQLSPEEIKIKIDNVVHEKNNSFIFHHKLANGDIRTVEVHSSKIDIESVDYLFSVIHDVTDRITAENVIRKKDELLELVKMSSGAGIWDWDMTTGELEWSDEMFIVFGLDRKKSEASFETWQSVLHPDDLEEASQRINQAIAQRVRLFNEYRVVHKDGAIHWISAIGQSYYAQDGTAVRMIGICLDITAQKQSEELLNHASHKYEVITNTTTDGFWVCDLEGNVTSANNKCCSMYGYTLEEIVTKSIHDFEVIENTDEIREHIKDIEMKLYDRFITQHRCKDGSILDVEISTSYIPGYGILAFTRDITQQKLKDQALRTSEEKYRSIVARQTEFVDRYLPGGILTYVNEALAQFTGLPEEELLGKSFYPFLHKDDHDETVRQIESIDRESQVVETESRIVLPDGRVRWNRWTHTGFFDDSGTLIEYQSVGRDITERKEAEDHLLESRRVLLESQKVAHIGSYVTDLRTGIWEASPEIYTIFGIDESYPNTLEGFLRFLPPDSLDSFYEYHLEVERDRKTFDLEYKIIRSNDGEERWVHGLGKLICDDQSNPIKRLGTIQDITERKRIEEDLIYRLAELNAIYNHAPMMMCLIDTERRILYANPAFRVFQGITEAELVGGHACGVFGCVNATDDPLGCGHGLTCRDCTLLRDIVDCFQTGTEHLNQEHTITLNSKGIQQNFALLGSTALVNSGDQKQVLLCLQDISSLKKAESEKQALEKQLIQAQKLESLGVLAGGIAHDFNNILAIIMGHCSLTEMNYEKAPDHIPEIEKAVARAAELCRQMLAYAGKAQFVQKQVNIAELIEEMVKMLRSTIKQNVVILSSIADDIPSIKADASQIRQVVMNLIINGAEAIGETHGEVRVSLAKTEIKTGSSEKDYLGKIIPAGWYGCLEVTDNGCGMSDETYNRIFEPFYTTKFTGRGLGLSAVLGIITAQGGALQLVSQLGKGTTFKVYLPLQISDVGAKEIQKPVVNQQELWSGSGTILLVEDEEQILQVAKAMLMELGFRVIEARNGKQAIEQYQKNTNDINLVITDLGMPVMDGYALIKELKRRNSALPIIISSGFGDAEITSRISRDDIAGLIGKPYNFILLRDVLMRLAPDFYSKPTTLTIVST